MYPEVVGTDSGCRSPLLGRGWASGLWAGPGRMLWPALLLPCGLRKVLDLSVALPSCLLQEVVTEATLSLSKCGRLACWHRPGGGTHTHTHVGDCSSSSSALSFGVCVSLSFLNYKSNSCS